MSKKFSQFVQESYIKSINEEELAELLNDLAEEHDLTEEETQEVLDEIFGIGSTLKRIGQNIASPFQHIGAFLAGKRDKFKNMVDRVKVKSRAADKNAAGKLAAVKQAKATSLRITRVSASKPAEKVIATGLQRNIDRGRRQADIRVTKAGGGLTSTGSAYIKHPDTGLRVALSHDDAAALGRGEKTARDIVGAPKSASKIVRAPTRRR